MANQVDDPRRQLLISMLSAGVFAAGVGFAPRLVAMGKVPRVIPPGKSFFEIDGEVRVNGQLANLDTVIKTRDVVATGAGSHAVFVVGRDAFILRSQSEMQIEGGAIIQGLRLFSGKVLSVFGRRNRGESLLLRSGTATIGIRGTGIYMEADPEQTYFCTCYGSTEIRSSIDKNQVQHITSEHHDDPRYLLSRPDNKGRLIVPAPMINHNDLELALVEELVGRTPPFGLEGDSYSGPRRSY